MCACVATKELMKRMVAVLVLMLVALPLFGGKDKKNEWRPAKLVDVKSQDMQSDRYNRSNNVDPTGRQTGSGFSSAPAHYIVYNIVIETEEEAIWASFSSEVTYRPPDLKIGSEIEFKPSGPKFIELKDAAGKKYEFKVTKREKKEPAPVKQ